MTKTKEYLETVKKLFKENIMNVSLNYNDNFTIKIGTRLGLRFYAFSHSLFFTKR